MKDSTADLPDIRSLLVPTILTDWQYYPLSQKINNARVKDDDAVKPVGEAKKFETSESS